MTKKTYQEVVRGIRTAKDPTMYISEVVTEIRNEIKGTDRNDKVVSLQKLMYLNLLGYSFEWAEFHVIEVMSQPLYKDRRVGYLAATVLIRPDSELFILCANSLKKAFLSKNKYDVGLALDCFSMVVTEELSRDLLPDILNLLKSKRAFVRRKATLCLFRIYKQYPASLEESFEPIVSLLIDPDISVQSSAVSVITELARIDPSRYQSLAPTIFDLLLHVDNTWILIKVIKLLMYLVTEEPRLAKKILDPLVNVVRTAETMSLLFEALVGVAQCLVYMPVKAGSKLAKEVGKISELLMVKLMTFVENEDPNLKYLGLCGLLKLVQVSPMVVAKKSFVYVGCLKENDSTIRSKALSLIKAIANPKNLKNLVEDLISCLHSGSDIDMREEIITGVVDMCSRNTYANTQDFSWYVAVLVDLACTKGSYLGELIAGQLIEVCLRVPAIRLFTVNAVLPLLLQPEEVAITMREYSGYLQQDQIANVFASLASASVVYLPAAVQATILQSLLQVSLRFICAVGSATQQAALIKKSVIAHADQFLSSASDEVRYRAALLREVLQSTDAFANEVVAIESHGDVQKEIEEMNNERKNLSTLNEKCDSPMPEGSDVENISDCTADADTDVIQEETKVETPTEETVTTEVTGSGIKQLSELLDRLTEELLPVSAKAQRKVKVPEGLDLDKSLATFDLEKPVEEASTITFIDAPLFTYMRSKTDSDVEKSRRHKDKKGHHHRRDDRNKFYLSEKKEEEEGEVRILTFEDVGVAVVEEEKKEEEEEVPSVQFTVIRDAESSSEGEKPKKEAAKPKTEEGSKEEKRGRSHRHHSVKKEEATEVKGEEKHRRRHH